MSLGGVGWVELGWDRLGWVGFVCCALSDRKIPFQSCLGAACLVWAFYVGFLAELGS